MKHVAPTGDQLLSGVMDIPYQLRREARAASSEGLFTSSPRQFLT